MKSGNFPAIDTNRCAVVTLRGALLVMLLVTGIWAQDESDSGEVSAYTGIGFGTLGTHFTAGGSVGTTLWHYASEFIESGYVHLGNSILVPRAGVSARDSGLYDFDLAFQVRIPLRSKWEPYFLFAPAALYNRYQIEGVQADGSVIHSLTQDVWRFGFEIGPGVRYHIARNWGLRGEYRYILSTQNFSRLQLGVFRKF